MEYQENEVVTISLERYEELRYEKCKAEEDFTDLLIAAKKAFDFTELEKGTYVATTDKEKLLALANYVKKRELSMWAFASNDVKELVINTNGGNE